MSIESINPATGEQVAKFDEATPEQIEAALTRSEEVFRDWRTRPVAERAALFGELAKTLRANAEELAGLVTLEMGKILAESKAEVEKCAVFCDYIAERGPELLAPRTIEGGNDENYVRFEPLGTILAVMPWNFPYVQVFRFAPAALTAGNVAVLKHASNVPQCAIAIERMFSEAGFPDGVFQTLLVGPGAVEGIIADRRVRGVTLTGSDLAGSKVAALAGRELKTAVMELGGSDPFVVLDDADIDLAVKEGTRARNINAGQACISAKRFIVADQVADEFEAKLAESIGSLVVGDPTDPATQVGPLARPDLVDTLREQVEDSIAAGAEALVGGFEHDGPGSFVEPLVLTGVEPQMRVFREETFGPVAAVVRVPDEAAAIAAANDSDFGLGASVFSQDVERAKRVAAEIDAGMIFINTIVVSDPRLPFGGVKRSGFGRELGEWGVLEFVDVKSVAVVAPGPGGGLTVQVGGATVFLSGANRGLGRVLAEQLLAADVARLYAAARNPDALAEVVALDPDRVIAVTLDTTDHAAVDAAASLAADTTLLINNAGVGAFAPGLSAPPDDVAREMATNFGGTYAMVRAFAPVIEGNGGGAIVNVLSMAGLAAIPPLAGYSASKAAAHSMTQAVRAELRPRGVGVHGVYPAGIGTEMLAHPSIPHSSPEEVAAGILAGVEAGDEDIFPCALSRAESEVWWADPKGLERQHTGH